MADAAKFTVSGKDHPDDGRPCVHVDFGALPVRDLFLYPDQAIEVAAEIVKEAMRAEPRLAPSEILRPPFLT